MRGATRCRMHGGKNQLYPPGDPRRGGAPEKHGLYSRHLRGEQLEAFERATVGNLDREIRLAKAKLDWATKRWSEDPEGGVEIVAGQTVQIRPWSDIVDQWTERVRKLELARRQLQEGTGGDARSAFRAFMDLLRGSENGGEGDAA